MPAPAHELAPTPVPPSQVESAMRTNRFTTQMRRCGWAVILPLLVVALAGAVPTPQRWVGVALARHEYGRLAAPQRTVAQSGPERFTFTPGDQGASIGPNTFDVAADGSVWMAGRDGFVTWSPGSAEYPGSPDSPRVIPAGFGGLLDLAVAADGTLYTTEVLNGPIRLVSRTATGQTRWTAPITESAGSGLLRVGADGVVYLLGNGEPRVWVPLTTTGGAALPVAQQAAGSSPYLTLAGGLRLAEVSTSMRDLRYVLVGGDGAVLRGWRLTSSTDDISTRGTPAVLGGDLVVSIGISRTQGSQFRYEYLTLRISPAGRLVRQLATDSRGVWGDPQTTLRVGPDGALYELRASPTSGVRVSRYALTAAISSPTATSSPTAASSPTVTATPAATSSPAVTSSPSRTTAPAGNGIGAGTVIVLLTGAAALAALAAAGVLWRQRRR